MSILALPTMGISSAGNGDTESGAAEQVKSGAKSVSDQIRQYVPLVAWAIVIMVVGYVLMRVARRALRKGLERSYDESFSNVTTRLFGWGFMLVVLLLAIAVTFPSVSVGGVLSSMGFISVAIGFAFKDILENSIAGLLLLMRQPFKIDDQIEVVDVFGTVEEISIRETRIRRRDGQIMVVPNRDVYQNKIRVQTESSLRRFAFYIEFDYVEELGDYIDTIVAGIGEVDGVVAHPPPKGRVDDTGSEMVTCKFMGWTSSDQSHFNDCRNRVIQHTIAVMKKNDIPIPNDIAHTEIVPEKTGGEFEL